MARGDAYIWSGQVTNNGYTTFTPGSGIEVCITAMLWSPQYSSNAIPFVRRTSTNGELTDNYNTLSSGNALPNSAASNYTNVKIFVTNSNSLWMVSSGSGTWDFFFSGIQTK